MINGKEKKDDFFFNFSLILSSCTYLISFRRWDLSTSATSVLKWLLQRWGLDAEPPEPSPACPQDWWESQTACVAFYCGLLFCFWTHVWAAWPNRKGGYIGYSMTCVSRSSSIWSFKSFCLKDLVLRGGTVYDTLAGPLINWNQFFKGNH